MHYEWNRQEPLTLKPGKKLTLTVLIQCPFSLHFWIDLAVLLLLVNFFQFLQFLTDLWSFEKNHKWGPSQTENRFGPSFA